MAIVPLSTIVQKAIKKAGSDIKIVEVEERSPSTVGLCHLKLRHFDHFVEYFLRNPETQQQERLMAEYCKVRGLSLEDEEFLVFYGKLQRIFADRYDALVRVCPESERKIMRALIPSKNKERFFKELLETSSLPQHEARCIELDVRCEELLRLEAENASVFGEVHKDMKNIITPILESPWRIYKELKRKDSYTFCSDGDEMSFVLGLSVSENERGKGNLITGYKRLLSELNEAGKQTKTKYKRIYEEG